jgi:integrase
VPGSIKRRCHCKNPQTGREYGSACPQLTGSKHGDWEYRDRLDSSTGRRSYRRGGFARRADAEEHGRLVRNLVALACGERHDINRIGDLLFGLRRGAPLPPVDEVRRKLGLRGDLSSSITVGSWLDQWLAGKRKLRESTAETYATHIRIYLNPMLGQVPLDRLRAEHIDEMVDRIGEWNAEIAEARAEGRHPNCEGDIRRRVQVISNATLHRVVATLRNALNGAIKARRINVNPAQHIELPPEDPAETVVWGPAEVNRFLDFIEDDGEMGLLFRTVVIHGPRRGEIVGARWAGFDEATGHLTLKKTILSISGRITESTPKTKAGERTVHLDGATRDMYLRHRVKQAEMRLAMGEAWTDNDLIFCRPTGEPWPPDLVSRRWRTAVAAAGLPPIRFHDGRHTAATLGLEAGIDIKIVSERMGHSKTGFTRDRYQHVRKPILDKASETVVSLLAERHRRRPAGPVSDGVSGDTSGTAS